MAVKKRLRGGRALLIVDFTFRDKSGRTQRYRRDAAIQTMAGAKAEEQRLRFEAVTTGEIRRLEPAPTFAAFVAGDVWRGHLALRCRPETTKRYGDLFRQHLLATFGRVRLDQIDRRGLEGFEAVLVGRGIKARGPVSLVRSVLRVAVGAGVLHALPEMPPLPKASDTLPSAPDRPHVDAMLGEARGWVRTAVALAAFAGLRSGEVRALEVRDVDLAHGVITVRHAISDGQVVTPKGKKERTVPIFDGLRPILAAAMAGKGPGDRIVVNANGQTPRRQSVLDAVVRVQARLGVADRCSFHQLRHAFCSVMIRNGASVEAVRGLAGHTNLRVTQRYVHANGADHRDAIACLGKSGNGAVTGPEVSA